MTLPLFPSLAGYRRDWLSRDAVAGLTVWAVLVPEVLAYATIAGVSPVVGLYAAPRGVRLALARDVGQVRDLLSRVGSESQVRTFRRSGPPSRR